VDGVCTSCGFATGEANRCPHCQAIARVEPRGDGKRLRWVCGACGGPRMPGGLGAEAARTPLREARGSETRATRARAGFWVFALMAAFFTLVAVAAWPAALFWKLFFLATAVVPAVLAMRARGRAGRADAAAHEALDRAWLAAAEDVAKQSKSGVTVAELAARLKIDPGRADHLLTQLAVHDRTRIDVGDDAEVRYSVGPDTGVGVGRVRVDASSSEEQFRALEAAEAEGDTIHDEEAAQRGLLGVPFPTTARGPRSPR
jgi:hypothetical protein